MFYKAYKRWWNWRIWWTNVLFGRHDDFMKLMKQTPDILINEYEAMSRKLLTFKNINWNNSDRISTTHLGSVSIIVTHKWGSNYTFAHLLKEPWETRCKMLLPFLLWKGRHVPCAPYSSYGPEFQRRPTFLESFDKSILASIALNFEFGLVIEHEFVFLSRNFPLWLYSKPLKKLNWCVKAP